MNLAPARWIWFPSRRTLPNTFVLFRRSFTLPELPLRVHGWVIADSRYRLSVNGQRVQWGPAPADPRFSEVDPLDITVYLHKGDNVIGVEVLYYGHGEGTWISGKPGLLLQLAFSYQDGRQEQLVTDETWLSLLDRAHKPGQYKRWYLRALQEEFDARLQPVDWNVSTYMPDDSWLPAQILDAPADKPAGCGSYKDYLADSAPAASNSSLLPRQIPLLNEQKVSPLKLTSAGYVHWRRDPLDWFEMRTPEAFSISRDLTVVEAQEEERWHCLAPEAENSALYLTFEWTEQLVGWPYFTIEATEGTIVEVIHQESHDPAHTEWLDNHFYSWSRFICRAGQNTFESFDYESLRWLQLHIRNMTGPVTITHIGVRRREYAWPQIPQITCAEPELQRLFAASINTIYNSAQETCVDGMGRERQQYSGDGSHQLWAIRSFFGETRLPTRFLNTYSAGQTHEGYFLDSWPAYDRLVRIAQRQVQTSPWGPILDHSIGFVFDTWYHYLETGDLEAVRMAYGHFKLLASYLDQLRTNDPHNLLPVENMPVTIVWIDHEAYQQQRHKQCAFNLYTAAMLQYALVPLAHAFEDQQLAQHAGQLAEALLTATIQRFWSHERNIFVNNLPWLDEDAGPRLCDRSLATAILFQQCPDNHYQAALQALVECPADMGFSYPANAGWRYWALGRYGRTDSILQDFRQRWASMKSVKYNNTLQEFWDAAADSTAQWSHCPVAPLYILSSEIIGLRATSPGFTHYSVQPQLADLAALSTTLHTVRGSLIFHSVREEAGHRITLQTLIEGEGVLIVPFPIQTELLPLSIESKGPQHYRLQPSQTITFWLPDAPVKAY
ncbi:hypothetical protein KDA_58890 [Dictyobacter alpinus]|uniref:Alpha-L-rhamnosidase six-hairpin glycosidase domain-containing protein n=1 Tax=Dictyobacter alpinus TaxID=2014873 RepID=A0A402BGA3_9CHLR|nr:alpha-L-rhamnosidase N-terminal domain-containing protein [Dictyobacter alpinus]GCE30405.1 hypothetical protein KDA_58890 [Dictyobacter alpinus]